MRGAGGGTGEEGRCGGQMRGDIEGENKERLTYTGKKATRQRWEQCGHKPRNPRTTRNWRR